jgi:hypothetical protein
MTLSPEREAEIRRFEYLGNEHEIAQELLVALDAEREAHQRLKDEYCFEVDIEKDRDTLLECVREMYAALEVFDNRKKLAHSLRGDSPQLASFMSAVADEVSKYANFKSIRKKLEEAGLKL